MSDSQTTKWLPGKDAPKDGSLFWGYLYDAGIKKLRWSSPEDAAAKEGGDPEEYYGAFVDARDHTDEWTPEWFLPLSAIPELPHEE